MRPMKTRSLAAGARDADAMVTVVPRMGGVVRVLVRAPRDAADRAREAAVVAVDGCAHAGKMSGPTAKTSNPARVAFANA
jgi:hypothetical protein